MELTKTIFAFFIGAFAVFAGFAALIIIMALLWAIPTMLLWDWLMPELFGLSTITIWQAIGINLLSGILFKNKNFDKKKEGKTTKFNIG